MKSFQGESGQHWSYDETSPIGEPGGMGSVFEGFDDTEGSVAVKLVELRGHSEGDKKRRQREVDIADRLIEGLAGGSSVDHLLLPLDRGLVGDDLLIVMPRAVGSLNAAIRSGGDGTFNALDVMRQVCRGLVELAELSILHRDLKPANVLMHEGRWKLADFGLARNAAESTGTFTFLGPGTDPYRAPELWQLKAATVRSDLYSLGVMAFELFAGRRPFGGPDLDDFRRQHLNDDPAVPESLDPTMQRVILRLLRKDPNERYQDARSVLDALDRVVPTLEPDQQVLVAAALEADRRQSEHEADLRRTYSAMEAEEASRVQAQSNLQEILEEAQERGMAAVPEVTLDSDGLQWHFGVPSARLTIQPYVPLPFAKAQSGDPLVMGWGVFSSIYGERSVIANIVCEERPAGQRFFILRFTANEFMTASYGLGPTDHPHGFVEQTFFDQRAAMIGSGSTNWQRSTEPFDAALLVTLLAAEIASPRFT